MVFGRARTSKQSVFLELRVSGLLILRQWWKHAYGLLVIPGEEMRIILIRMLACRIFCLPRETQQDSMVREFRAVHMGVLDVLGHIVEDSDLRAPHFKGNIGILRGVGSD